MKFSELFNQWEDRIFRSPLTRILPQAPGVYMLWDCVPIPDSKTRAPRLGDELLYIGRAENIYGRISEHSRDQIIPWTMTQFVRLNSPELRDRFETHLIKKNRPPYNRRKL
jgi:excinuclease UvrABC nuclease subunit